MKSGPRRREAWLPRLIAHLNSRRTRALIPEFGSLPAAEKIDRAVRVFRRLADEEPDADLRPSRRWSLEYMEACARGAGARRQFLIDEGVFEGGELLVAPARVQPQMEIGNLDPASYSGSFSQEVAALRALMFQEYFGVKSLLAIPEAADLVACIAPTLVGRLPPPRLKLSLLLRDYVERIVSETRRGDLPLVAVFGEGKGEELVPLVVRGLSVICFDAHDQQFTRDLLLGTFRQSAVDPPEMVALSELGEVHTSVSAWKRLGCSPTIFILSDTDVTRDELFPEQLHGIASVAASVYLLHELRRKEAFFANLASISKGSIVVFDGNPSTAGLDNIVLPVSDRHEAVVTGHDAVVSHLLSQTPAQMEAIARRAVPELHWESSLVGPPLPPPLFYKLQGAVIGRRSR